MKYPLEIKPFQFHISPIATRAQVIKPGWWWYQHQGRFIFCQSAKWSIFDLFCLFVLGFWIGLLVCSHDRGSVSQVFWGLRAEKLRNLCSKSHLSTMNEDSVVGVTAAVRVNQPRHPFPMQPFPGPRVFPEQVGYISTITPVLGPLWELSPVGKPLDCLYSWPHSTQNWMLKDQPWPRVTDLEMWHTWCVVAVDKNSLSLHAPITFNFPVS